MQIIDSTAIFWALKKSFGSNLRDLRKPKYKRSKDLAAALDVTPAIVSRWENDGTGPPEAGTLVKLAMTLGCSIDSLLDGVYGYRARDLVRHDGDQQSGSSPRTGDPAHDPIAARLELDRLTELVTKYKTEARKVLKVSDALDKVAIALEEIGKTDDRTASRGSRARKAG